MRVKGFLPGVPGWTSFALSSLPGTMLNTLPNHRRALVILLAALATTPSRAGFLYPGTSPANRPWPGGIVPYVIDPALSAAQRQAYLDGIREWELAGNVHFVPRTTETGYVFLKYDPSGPNRVSGSNPQLVEINALTRSQICHETGHSLGLNHEHIRPDRNSYVNVLTANITSGNAFWFDIDPSGVTNGAYDFESVMHFGRDLFSTSPGVLETLSPKPGYGRYQVRMGNFALSPGDRAAITWLYGAVTLSPVVTTTADAGPGSLRAALYYATDHPGTTVTFNIPTSDPGYASGVFTIKPTGHLPPLVTNGTKVDATTQPGYAGKPKVFVDGSAILSESGDPPGLMIYAADCTVKGLAFVRSRWVGVAILQPDATGNTVCSCWSGVDATGNSAAANSKQGVQISGGAHGNTIGPDNVLSGNTEYGVWISGAGTNDNIVTGSRVGTNDAGTASLANGLGGVIVTDGAQFNTIGGGNVISGNTNAGVWITGTNVLSNTVDGNFIGTNAAGNTAVPNTATGIYVVGGASDNVVSNNVVSGNGVGFGYGIVIADTGSDDNVVQGNLIGTRPDGGALGNAFAGVAMWGGTQDNIVFENRIAHNASIGVALYDPTTTGHTFRMNSISNHGFAGIAIGGSNHSQAAPSLTSAVAGGTGIAVSGSLASTPNSAFRIEFFASSAPGSGEGKTFIGALDGVTTNGVGSVSFSSVLPAAVSAGKTVTATATSDAAGDTSEFSLPVAVTFTDADNDGLPDGYETSHGLIVGVNDAGLDPDGDGADNLAEYIAGTDPHDRADVFKAISVTRTGGDVEVRFRVVPGRTYQIEKSETLAPGSWSILVPVSHADSNELVITTPWVAGKRFYRALLAD